jgi:hypothetical protein
MVYNRSVARNNLSVIKRVAMMIDMAIVGRSLRS